MSRPAYHQDYIARIRYSNILPPPPNPPKLLDIPGTGLGGGQYLTAASASKLAREQPLNIEADGELGMPIDLVGLPGVLYGDDTAINALDNPPVPHPHDKLLLRPVNQLGKPASMAQGVSFLRRTEYISSDVGGRTRADGTPRGNQLARKRKAAETERDDDPVRMLRGIYKGFDIAYPEDAHKGPDSDVRYRADAISADDQGAWDHPHHPTNPELKPLDTYSILPDLEAAPGYWIIKFATNPVAPSDTYDKRLDYAILHPKEPYPRAMEEHQAQMDAYAADSTLERPAAPAWNFHLYLPEEAPAVKAAFDVNNEDNDDTSLYPHANAESGRKFFRFDPQRVYETVQVSDYAESQWDHTVALALHDGDEDLLGERKRNLPTAAYYYPISQRSAIRSKRGKNVQPGFNGLAAAAARDEEEERAGKRVRPWDYLALQVRDEDEGEVERRMDQVRYLEGEHDAGPA